MQSLNEIAPTKLFAVWDKGKAGDSSWHLELQAAYQFVLQVQHP